MFLFQTEYKEPMIECLNKDSECNKKFSEDI